MIYPQITGEPNFILIGVSAVFGLLVIIIVYYIVISKNIGTTNTNLGLGQIPVSESVSQSVTNMSLTSANAQLSTTNTTNNDMPVPINTGGYYAPAPTATSLAPTQSNSSIKQVFNIKENIYSADDAGGACGVFGADVASLQQLVDAHRQGANWCNVGWTKEGLAAYPIQYSFWQVMQGNDPGNRNICGQPGINLSRNDAGLLYGVNCYGVKPEPKNGELVKEVVQNDADIALKAKIAQFQKNLNNMTIAPFNANEWSE
jgi:hypothetical protein